MNRSVWLVVLLALVLAGCSSNLKSKARSTAGTAPGQTPGPPLTPQEVRAQEAIQLFDRATELFKSVHDRESATAVGPELKKVALRLQELHRQGVPMGSEVHDNPQAVGRFQRDLEKAVDRYAGIAVQFVEQADRLGPEFQGAFYELAKLPS